jgi:HAD superfamily hydrolase (TIGR01509 family)
LIRAALFDWDGTIVNSYRAEIDATAAVFKHFRRPFSTVKYRQYFPDWRAFYKESGISETYWSVASEIFRTTYQTVEVRVRRGARQTLRVLQGRGLALGLVSSADRFRLRRQIQELNLENCFSVIIDGNSMRRQKPHPAPLLAALTAIKSTPDEAVFVGDTRADCEMAEAAHVLSFLVTSHYDDWTPAHGRRLKSWREVQRVVFGLF